MKGMELQPESPRLADYLAEVPGVVEWHTPLVHAAIERIKQEGRTDRERAELAFVLARDSIAHSFDTGDPAVPVSAEETLACGEGICFAKSHLLAALLRGMGIPCGFCYQRVTRKGKMESGHALHGLNAVHLQGTGWFRLDPRGNKPGVDAQFSTEEEKLAYPIREVLGEVDHPWVFTQPLATVLASMRNSADSQDLFWKRPEQI